MRQPDRVIYGPMDVPYMLRWHLIPRNRWFNIYLHRILHDDDDRALHDHPAWNLSLVLRGGYDEHTFITQPWENEELPAIHVLRRRAPAIVWRRATVAHRLVLRRDTFGQPIPAWTLWVSGAKLRVWGFWCPSGKWVAWQLYNAETYGKVGRGCGEQS